MTLTMPSDGNILQLVYIICNKILQSENYWNT